MIFKRREKLGFWSRLREMAVPRKSWRRGFQYIGRRVQRLPDTPHRIAIGFCCGVMASFSPFFTLHIFIAVGYALLVRGNLIAAAFGTIFGNPISFPIIAALSLKTGNWLMGRDEGVENLEGLTWDYVTNEPLAFMESIFTPYLIGGLLPGLAASALCYYLMRPIIARFQDRRRRILEKRARELISARRPKSRQGGGGSSSSSGPAPSSPAGSGGVPAPGLAASSDEGADASSKRSGVGLTRTVGGKGSTTPLLRTAASTVTGRRPAPDAPFG